MAAKIAKIIGIGSYLPEKILSNSDLEKMVDTSDEWITTRTGIKERRIAEENEYTSDMGVKAALAAIKDAKKSIDDIDFIIVATLSPDYLFPSTACIIQNKLNAQNIPCVDFQAACSGFIYGLSFAKALVELGKYKNILLIASEKLSSFVDYEDRSTCVIFGDGAAACIVSDEGNGYNILDVSLGADGGQSHLLGLPAGGCVNPASKETLENKQHFIKMNGNETYKHAVRRMIEASKETMKNVNLKESDISWLIPHQANMRIIEGIAKRFEHLPEERVYKKVIQKYGNTSASSVGIAFDDLHKSNVIKDRENILFSVFGAGLTWGAAIIQKNY